MNLYEYLRMIKDFKDFKHWGQLRKQIFITDLLRNLVLIGLGVCLYLWLNNTGLLIYLIFMLKLHWTIENSNL